MEYAKELQMDSQEAAVRMEEGRLYLPSDEEIMKKQFDCLEKLYDSQPDQTHDQSSGFHVKRHVCQAGGRVLH